MAALMTAITALTALSVIALLALLAIYVRNMLRARSKLLIGLVIFILLILAQDIVSLYYYITMMSYYVPQVMPQIFIFSLLQAVAFLVLLIISWD